MEFDVLVDVRLRGGIADPAGATIERALPALGYDGVSGVTVGKTVRLPSRPPVSQRPRPVPRISVPRSSSTP